MEIDARIRRHAFNGSVAALRARQLTGCLNHRCHCPVAFDAVKASSRLRVSRAKALLSSRANFVPSSFHSWCIRNCGGGGPGNAITASSATRAAAPHTTNRSGRRGLSLQASSGHAGLRYANQNPIPRNNAAPTSACGSRNAMRANATAPVTPRSATAHGTAQQRPSAAAKPPRPTAPPAAPTTFTFSSIGASTTPG